VERQSYKVCSKCGYRAKWFAARCDRCLRMFSGAQSPRPPSSAPHYRLSGAQVLQDPGVRSSTKSSSQQCPSSPQKRDPIGWGLYAMVGVLVVASLGVAVAGNPVILIIAGFVLAGLLMLWGIAGSASSNQQPQYTYDQVLDPATGKVTGLIQRPVPQEQDGWFFIWWM